MNKINLYARASEIAFSANSRYENNRARRSDLLNFMDANEWFGIKPEFSEASLLISADEYSAIESSLLLWIKAYKQPGKVKISLMLEAYGGIYPEACALFQKFIKDKDVNSSHKFWQLLDFILAEIDRDLNEYTEEGIENLVQTASVALSLQTAKLFSDFLYTAKSGEQSLSKWIYTFESREHPGLIGDAYKLGDYSVMAYCVFNEEAWHSQNMVAKAVASKALADLWLFAALHLICALRSGDMKRIPAPRLPYDADAIRDEILSGTFPVKYAAALTDELVARFNLKSMKPSKTQNQSNVAELKLFIPESLRAPLGIIIAIVLSHHISILPGSGFVRPDNSLYNIRIFFGEHFVKALGTRRFSSRRANKAYLQGIDLIANAEGSPGKPKGYILASLARGHKSGIGSLAQTTDIYLKDANFAGYTPEFIAHEMFERGVFGFIPAILLEIYGGKQYKALPVSAQTKLINVIGLSAGQIERTASTVEISLTRSKKVVANFFSGSASTKANVFRVLQNIASGNAPGKQDRYLCLITAASKRCPHPERSACMGCGYEILTKSSLHTLMCEYVRLSYLREISGITESMRCDQLLEQAVFPAVSEFMESAQLLYPDIDESILLDIIEEGLDYANRTTREIDGAPRTLAAYNTIR
jgi:hypothetical protein